MRDIEKIKKDLKEEMEAMLEEYRGGNSIGKDMRDGLKALDDPYTPGWLWAHLEGYGENLLRASKVAKELMYAYRNEELPKELTPGDFAMGLLKAMAGISEETNKNEETILKKYHFWQKIFRKKHSKCSGISIGPGISIINLKDTDYPRGCSSCSAADQ